MIEITKSSPQSHAKKKIIIKKKKKKKQTNKQLHNSPTETVTYGVIHDGTVCEQSMEAQA